MCRTLLVTLVIGWFALSVCAQDTTIISYSSEDGALQFGYPSEWFLEEQFTQFNDLYHYVLWNPARTEVDYWFGSENHSRILLDVRNANSPNFPDDIVTLQDYADYALSNYYVEPYTARNTRVEVLAGYPVIRMDISSLSEHSERLYVLVRDDGWSVFACLAAPANQFDRHIDDLVAIIESLMFNAERAAIPFEQNLELFDVSNIELTETYINADGTLNFRYPAGWNLLKQGRTGGFSGTVDLFNSYVIFTPDDYQGTIRIEVLDTINEGLGLPFDQNTTLEYMIARRNHWIRLHETLSEEFEITYTHHYPDENSITEFRIGAYDAVSSISRFTDIDVVQQQITMALNDTWVAEAFITNTSIENVAQYEAETVALLASLRFPIGQSFITSSLLTVNLPETWVYDTNYQDSDLDYQYILRPIADDIEANIVIELVNSEFYGATTDRLSLVEVRERLSSDTAFEVNPQTLVVNNYEVLQAKGIISGWFFEYLVFIANEDWIIFVFSVSEVEEEIEAISPELYAIISTLELTLPETFTN